MQIIELGQKFSKALSRKLKNLSGFGEIEFLEMLDGFFGSCGEKIGVSVGEDDGVGKLIGKFGSLLGC